MPPAPAGPNAPTPLDYTTIDGTTLRVSRLAYGTASLHHLFWRKERLALLEHAFDAGITHFDTSPYYGNGLAEGDLGRFGQRHRAALTLATKVGLYAPGRAATGSLGVWLRKAAGRLNPRLSLPELDWAVRRASESFHASLKRLRTDYVDLLLLHEPDPEVIEADAFLDWLQRERTAGRIRYWGIAGPAARCRPWIAGHHPLTAIIQAKDSLDDQQANEVAGAGRPLQFTYGYLSAASTRQSGRSAEAVLTEALQRNRTGAVLFSTRRTARIAEAARLLSPTL